jgi:cation diffusion facilitator family transporter
MSVKDYANRIAMRPSPRGDVLAGGEQNLLPLAATARCRENGLHDRFPTRERIAMAGANSTRAILFALGANFAIAAAKYVAAAITGSSSMLAEAVHSTADCGNQLLLLLGLRRARRPPTLDYPLGFGKEIYFWSFVVALLLFTIGGLFSIYEGIHKLEASEALAAPVLALGVLGFSIAMEAVSMAGALREVNKIRGAQGLWSWFRATRNSELVVVFGEDLAALVGLVFAFAAVLATALTGKPLYDAIGSIAIGALLVAVALAVAIEVKALLVGQGVEPAVRREMIAFLEADPSVERVFELLTLHMGPDVMVAVKACMREHPGQAALVDAINRVEVSFKSRFPEVHWIFFEPDVRD